MQFTACGNKYFRTQYLDISWSNALLVGGCSDFRLFKESLLALF